jgi:hypothetical protein
MTTVKGDANVLVLVFRQQALYIEGSGVRRKHCVDAEPMGDDPPGTGFPIWQIRRDA